MLLPHGAASDCICSNRAACSRQVQGHTEHGCVGRRRHAGGLKLVSAARAGATQHISGCEHWSSCEAPPPAPQSAISQLPWHGMAGCLHQKLDCIAIDCVARACQTASHCCAACLGQELGSLQLGSLPAAGMICRLGEARQGIVPRCPTAAQPALGSLQLGQSWVVALVQLQCAGAWER